ncbi:MAG: DUF4126 domain-containing protein [Nocardioidaceae bacterium]|nr:DUF4126 domain-containing protein [Nocardioidaceae bacterium]
MELLPLVLTSGWASGINAYAVVFVMGILGRVAGLEVVPETVQRPEVLAIAGGMFAVEFVADKIPFVDSMWDTVSTLIRPTVGAIVAYALAGDAESVDQALYAFAGGGAALASHLVKGGLRLAVNSSPEPFSNVAVSLGEDITVASVISLALYHPWIALGIASFLFITGTILVIVLFRLVMRGWRRWKAQREPAGVGLG